MSRRPAWWLAFLAKIWPITWISAKMTRWPVIGPLVTLTSAPLFSGKNLNITYLPINEEIESAGTLLPVRVIEELIRRSSHRVIINRCTCRDARDCHHHPVEYGCTLLGEGTREIDPRIARHVSKAEAIAHLHRTIEDGLVPMAGRVKVDNLIWGVRDRGKLLTVCHCCHCCCTLWTSGKYLPPEAARSMVPLKGLRMSVDHARCNHCGTCIDQCHMAAISLVDGKITHDAAKCIGCGRCVTICPKRSVTPEIDNLEDAIRELTERIGKLADVA